VWQIHRAIGMGGDQLITHVAGEQPRPTTATAPQGVGRGVRAAAARNRRVADAVPLLTTSANAG